MYRLRFLLAPPLIFLTTLWFDLRGLHGLVIFVFAWDIWHVLSKALEGDDPDARRLARAPIEELRSGR